MCHLFKTLALSIFCLLFSASAVEKIEILELDVINYEDFSNRDPHALAVLKKALYEKGIVGIKGIPGYREKVERFIENAFAFSALPEEVKEAYAPNHDLGDMFLGYEKGKERFQRPDGRWVIDDLKNSFYAFIPDHPDNKWPLEVPLRSSFEEIGSLMSEMGKVVMNDIELIGPQTSITVDHYQLGRMLYYQKNTSTETDNPFWCGAHFDHGIFTALLPAVYFKDGKQIQEPIEAGIFVRPFSETRFKKVIANDHDVLLFQVGEFGQLALNDSIHATEHRVHKARDSVERYTLALFFNAAANDVVHSYSELTQDPRYGGPAGSPCTYADWEEQSFRRYIVKDIQ